MAASIPLALAVSLNGGSLWAVALAALPAAALISFHYPAVLLASLILVTIVQEAVFVTVYNFTTLNKIIGVLLLFVVVARALVEGRVHRAVNMVSAALAALLLYLVSSYLILSVDGAAPLQNINNYISAFIYYFLCLLAVRNENDVLMVVLAYLAGGLIVAYSGSFWEAMLTPLEYLSSGRQGLTSDIAAHYIEYAVRCIMPLPVALALLSSRGLLRWWQSALLIPSAVVLSLAVLLSGSRGAVISYFFMAALLVAFTRIGAIKKAGLALAMLMVPLLLPTRQIVDNIMAMATGPGTTEHSAILRASYYQTMLSVGDPASFLWGHGLENFRYYYLNAAHSTWGQSLYELGIIGLGIQLFIVCWLARLFLKLRYGGAGMKAGLTHAMAVGLGVSVFVLFFWGLFENIGLIVGSKHLFIMIGAFIAASRIISEKAGEDHESRSYYA